MNKYLKPCEAWQYLRMEKTSFWERVGRREIPAVRLSARKVLFRVEDLDRYVEQHLDGVHLGDVRASADAAGASPVGGEH
jgi:predicted DNA-binding transcriptional regulator AlpA